MIMLIDIGFNTFKIKVLNEILINMYYTKHIIITCIIILYNV